MFIFNIYNIYTRYDRMILAWCQAKRLLIYCEPKRGREREYVCGLFVIPLGWTDVLSGFPSMAKSNVKNEVQ